MTSDPSVNIPLQLLNSVRAFQTLLDPDKREMLFITSSFYNWVWKLISKTECTICFLGMCSCCNYLHFKLGFFLLHKFVLAPKMVQSNLWLFYCTLTFWSFCICISSWHQEHLRGRKHKTKPNPVILSAQMCLVYIPGAALAGKHCRVCR